ncbi:MAG: glycosyltransferase family 87 protein [Acidocella sp.]|nr:glycosyltransferase family 87 protein [Acidocella sp.]
MGHLGFWTAFASWTIILTVTGAVCLRFAGLPWSVIMAATLCPSSLFVLMTGQISFLTGSFFIASLLLMDSRPAIAGGLAALTILKPQVALLGPIAFLSQMKWRGILAGLIFFGLICLLTTWALGPETWAMYLHQGMSSSELLLHLPFPTKFNSQYQGNFEYEGISVFYFLRSLGAGLTVASSGQILSATLAIIICWRLWRPASEAGFARVPLTTFLGLLVTPYAFIQDMFAFSVGIILMVWKRQSLEFGDVILLMYPAFVTISGIDLNIDIGPLFVLWAGLRAYATIPNPRHI